MNRLRRRPALRRAAFTFVQLLVVIAALAVLGLMLLPRLTRIPAKDLDRTRCASQLREISVAARHWAAEHQDACPSPPAPPLRPDPATSHDRTVCSLSAGSPTGPPARGTSLPDGHPDARTQLRRAGQSEPQLLHQSQRRRHTRNHAHGRRPPSPTGFVPITAC